MSEEEMQRQMEFIVNQQAQFAADIQRATEEREADAKLWQQKYSGLTDAMTFVVGTLGKLAEAQAQANARLAELAEAQKRTDVVLAETGERFNIFINVVERYISERRNGKADGNGPSAPGE
ncbi:MAG: hypothetical protein H0T45_12295 [Pyrinomonadaceae bacterium]|nr:hypothetical protein [Pyrinomonadaceae bacterium]MDQ3258729.1 hypothetical protein [Acidobacteriota bacterium]